MKNMLTLYDYFRSSACYRVRIALNLKGIGYDVVPIHLLNNGGEQLTATYQAINPQSLVPSLKDHDRILTQSLAIIEYLEDMYPSPPLLPRDPYEKALARAFALSIAADIHPIINLRVLKYLTNELKITEENKNKWYRYWVEKGLMALEKQLLSHQLSGNFCFGDTPTITDICLVPQLYNARRFNCDVSAFPTLVRIDAHCQRHPAFIQAAPENVAAEVKG